jgi:hypothetical protein
VSQSKSQLNDTLGTTEAATLLHMTRRAISKECVPKVLLRIPQNLRADPHPSSRAVAGGGVRMRAG